MQLEQFYNIATKVSSRKKCYYFWWSPWLVIDINVEDALDFFKIIISDSKKRAPVVVYPCCGGVKIGADDE